MSAVRYIFNTHGTYVAFVENNNIFTADNRWYGFKQGNLVFLKTGEFVGYLRDDDRIVRNKTNCLDLSIFRRLSHFFPVVRCFLRADHQ